MFRAQSTIPVPNFPAALHTCSHSHGLYTTVRYVTTRFFNSIIYMMIACPLVHIHDGCDCVVVQKFGARFATTDVDVGPPEKTNLFSAQERRSTDNVAGQHTDASVRSFRLANPQSYFGGRAIRVGGSSTDSGSCSSEIGKTNLF